MVINNLKKIWIIALILSIGAGLVLYRANEQRLKSLRGNLIFSSAETLDAVKKIELINNQQKITLYDDDNLWRVAEADNYYADMYLITALQEAIRSAKTSNSIKNNKNISDQWTTINLFDDKNNLLDSVQINDASNDGKHYIKYSHTPEIYRSNWRQSLPDAANAWTNKKLFNFDGREISRLEKDDVVISRRNEGAVFIDPRTNMPYHRFDYMKVFDAMSNIWYDKVLSSQEFDEQKYPYQQHIQFHTFAGLITDVYVYTDYQEYWIKIELSSDKLPTYDTVEYIENNQFLYTDWWFRIPTDEGRTLFMTKF